MSRLSGTFDEAWPSCKARRSCLARFCQERLESLIDWCQKEGIRTRPDLSFFGVENPGHIPLLTLGSTLNNELALFTKRIADLLLAPAYRDRTEPEEFRRTRIVILFFALMSARAEVTQSAPRQGCADALYYLMR